MLKLNKKGQALVEFVIILPIFLVLVMGMFDFGNILFHKYKLENSIDYIADLYESKAEDDIFAYLENNKLDMETKLGDDYAIIELSKNIDIVTPGLNLIIGDNYLVQTTKVIYEG